MNVLVADDDGVIRLLLSSALTKLGHTVHEATNGREAWDAWRGGEFSLVISDWMMPDLDGLEFCRRIRAEQRADYTYIVLLTSRSGKTNYLEAMNAGADDFITKPFEKDALAARVGAAERILRLHASLRTANTDLERRVLERTAELETALRIKGEFLSRASHELRTPMNHVLGFAQLLQMDALTDSQAGSVQQILTSGQHLLQLIDRILAVSKSDSEDLSFLETSETESRSARGTGNLMVFPSSSIPPPLEGRPPCRPRGCDSERLETGVEFLPKPCMAATLAHKVRELFDRPRLKPAYEQT
jgi:DNA-binding response OmpR family regulator